MESKRGKLVVFSSFKGGTGKSTLLLNIAGALSKKGKRVLLIDLNFESGDLSILLNSDMKSTIFNAIDDICNNRFREYNDYVTNICKNIDLVNSLKDPRQAYEIDGNYIELFLNNMKYKYDYILIDTTHGFASSTIAAIDSADINVFNISNDLMDIKSTKTALSIMNDVNLKNIILILNESIKLDNSYFTKNEIENIIKHKIDFVISRKCHVKNVNKYMLDGKILSLCEKSNVKDKVYEEIASKLING